MKQGKVSEVVLKRSVFKNIHAKNEKVISGGKVGGDCGIISNIGNRTAVATSGIVDYTNEYREYYTFYKAFNNLMSKGAIPTAIVLNIIMPNDAKEKQLKEVIKAYDFLCGKHNIAICSGHTQYTDQVNNIISTVTMFGEQIADFRGIIEKRMTCNQSDECTQNAMEDNDQVHVIDNEMQIVMTKAIGIEGTAIISNDKESFLRERFHGTFCDECLKFKEYISVEQEAKIAVENGALFMHDVSGTGVFGAIWELASVFEMGAEINLRNIPVWQETIEVTELFDINPYKMVSQGSLLIVTYDGAGLVSKLEEKGIPASVIGTLVQGNDKVLMNNGEKRFLEPPRGDEIYKVEKELGK